MLADPEGSGLYGWVKSNDLSVSGSSITEGIGQSRVTANLEGVEIDDAVRIPDPEALEQIYDLLIHEGLSVGGSAGINVAAAIRVAREHGPRPHHRDDPVRRRLALPVEAVQPAIPAREKPAGSALARVRAAGRRIEQIGTYIGDGRASAQRHPDIHLAPQDRERPHRARLARPPRSHRAAPGPPARPARPARSPS